MQRLVVLALVGLAAQLVDGALGMGYGATSATMLLAAGLTPVASSASIHLAEIGTTLFSAGAHHRLGNVHWGTVHRIAVPGAVGGFVGAVALTRIPADVAAPVVAVFLFSLGVVILLRFGRVGAGVPRADRGSPSTSALVPLGLVAGFFDAVGGGGWGPISTSTLLASGRMSPRNVIGSVDTSEFLVTVAASAGFLLALGTQSLVLPVVGALLAGGLVAAPIAAWLVRRLPAHLLGVLVGGMILLTNVRTLASAFALPGVAVALLVVGVVAAFVVALSRARRAHRAEQLVAVGSPG